MRGDAFTFYLAGGVFRVVPWLADELPRAPGRGRAAMPGRNGSTRSRRSAPCGWRSPKRAAARSVPATSARPDAAPQPLRSMTDTSRPPFATAHACTSVARRRARAGADARRSDASHRLSSGCQPAARRFRSTASSSRLPQRGASISRARRRSTSTSSSGLGARRSAQLPRVHAAASVRPRQPAPRRDPLPERRDAATPRRECERYERAIARAGGIDLQILGLGTERTHRLQRAGARAGRPHASHAPHAGDARARTPRSSAAGPTPCRAKRCRWAWRRSFTRAGSCCSRPARRRRAASSG